MMINLMIQIMTKMMGEERSHFHRARNMVAMATTADDNEICLIIIYRHCLQSFEDI